jgi:hypothetical protein
VWSRGKAGDHLKCLPIATDSTMTSRLPVSAVCSTIWAEVRSITTYIKC